ncbi:MAG TPA: hypothetical protein PLY70_05065 [Saprospiraceae bacterium]|nr:hypothetical protein [Saprospiraceae bacterium]HPN68759.1 hypothetical protein [Saprospiraceae bacterium]
MADFDLNEKRMHFEHDLINRRLSWLLTSQSILFAAMALAFEDSELCEKHKTFIELIPVMGGVISLSIFSGVLAGAFAKYKIWKKSESDEWGVRTWITRWALLGTDLLLPIIFAIIWLCIGMA